jgi:hypothetical protein
MHIVYLIKINKKSLPNMYIGSKSNCSVVDNRIYCSNNKVYIGSSKDKEYQELMRWCEDYTIQVLATFTTYDEALKAEKHIHMKYDVVASPEYYNKSIATISNYTNPNYATYKHLITGKVSRLPRDHPKVISKEWVGVTSGTILTEEERKSRGRSGQQNGFYGRTHSEETKKKSGKKIGDVHRGKAKSIEQRRKMSEARRMYWAARKEREASRKEESI